eukprot:5828310-Pleurochrysis_carterae.AAC.1
MSTTVPNLWASWFACERAHACVFACVPCLACPDSARTNAYVCARIAFKVRAQVHGHACLEIRQTFIGMRARLPPSCPCLCAFTVRVRARFVAPDVRDAAQR